MKNRINLTESELNYLIEKAVQEQLNEGAFDFLKGMGRKVGGDMKKYTTNKQSQINQGIQNFKGKVNNAMNSVSNYANNKYQAGKEAYNNAMNSVSNYANNKYQAGKEAYNNAMNSMSNYAKDVRNAGAYASEQAEREKMIQKNIAQRQQTLQKNISDAQNAIKLLTDLTQRGVLKNGSSKMAINTLKKYINGYSNY